jgi:MazG family protein
MREYNIHFSKGAETLIYDFKDFNEMTGNETTQLSSLIQTMRQLRSENGCPWDRQQTPESLRPYILEEAYELVDAIDAGNNTEILAELGDLLLQVIFQAEIFAERGLFGIGDIAEGIDRKLRRRHPHIFTENHKAQQQDWEQIKQQELREKGMATDFLSRQPKNLPALKLADKCCRHLNKNTTHIASILSDTESQQQDEILSEENLAESIFTLVYKAQKQGIDSDLALRKYVLNLLQKITKNESL